MKKQIPILMSAMMVQALLDGRKTQTRRIVELPYLNNHPSPTRYVGNSLQIEIAESKRDDRLWHKWEPIGCPDIFCWIHPCKWKAGDILWVRETWRKYCRVDEHGYTHFDDEIVEYAADGPPPIYLVDGDGFHLYNKDGSEKYVPWRPSIFMPKERARIWLEVTDIRVERLQDIGDDDAKAEGVELHERGVHWLNYEDKVAKVTQFIYNLHNAKESFRSLWNLINGRQSWRDNPWVCVVSFKVLSTTGKPENLKVADTCN